MSDSNSETTTTTPKNVDTAASNSSNAQPGNATTTVHRSPQKSRQNHNHNHNHNHNTNHGNHNSKNVNSNIGGGGGRKRRYTVGVAELHGRPGYPKRTRRKDDDDPFEPPTVFKLGGNIHDPLNLNGIGANPGQTTPISSPFPSPFPLPADKSSSSSRENASKEKVEVLIPPNICDPLNLSCPNALNESDLISPTNFKSNNNSSNYGRQRNNSNSNSKRRRTSSETEVANEGAGKQQRSGSFHDSKLLFSRDDSFLGRRNTTGAAAAANRANREKLNAERKISPVAATTAAAAASAASSASSSGGQAGKSSNHGKSFSRSNSSSQGGSTNANRNRNRQQGPSSTATTAPDPQSSAHTSSSSEKPAPKNNNKERFRFGNYNRYYGYRNSQHCDRRLELLPRDLIQGKDVLDVGCNIGHVTLTLARDYGPRRIVGVDIDPALIEVAKKNVRHYITEAVVQREGMPLSMPLLYGPLANMPKQVQGEDKETEGGGGDGFPNNVFFFALNYVPESDALLEVQEEEYDAIICLSLTKWIHLNWGDAGIRRLFQRAFRALRPGGCLILEPQPWSSYQKKAKLTPQIQSTYRSIRFRPDSFNEYLLKDVGFKSCELLGTPQNTSKGFQRPIYLYKKPAAPLKSATAAVSASTSASATESPAPASSSSS